MNFQKELYFHLTIFDESFCVTLASGSVPVNPTRDSDLTSCQSHTGSGGEIHLDQTLRKQQSLHCQPVACHTGAARPLSVCHEAKPSTCAARTCPAREPRGLSVHTQTCRGHKARASWDCAQMPAKWGTQKHHEIENQSWPKKVDVRGEKKRLV